MKPLIIANWKMNPQTFKETKRFFSSAKNGLKKNKNVEVVICPPFIYMSVVSCQLSNAKLGAQDLFWEKKGAYTGEISPVMLKEAGCRYVIIGHSERRRYFNETDEMINNKLKAALDVKLNPILCIGETEEERGRGEIESVLKKQIESAFNNISSSKFQASRVSIAYEPVWAIGTGNACDVEEAQKIGLLIKKIISRAYSRTLSEKTPILYGGSVNSKNARDYIKEACLQGLLIGKASLDAAEFIKILKTI